ncbi:hypothetical protein ANO11243_021400 [Dothideomycetidae sp. 11243]|nr:hypothetical protein ANO11243_021400 [fungal sp. No.11243]
MHVDKRTGQITGIVDWGDAKVSPFAIQFWGRENILGIRRTTKMDFHPRHIERRRVFWYGFYQEIREARKDKKRAMKTARMVGIFLANGELSHHLDTVLKNTCLAVFKSMTLDRKDGQNEDVSLSIISTHWLVRVGVAGAAARHVDDCTPGTPRDEMRHLFLVCRVP